MSKRSETHHVVTTSTRGWTIKRGGGQRASSDSHGRDPFPPRG